MPGADEFKNKIIFKKKINNLKLGYVSHNDPIGKYGVYELVGD